MQTSFDIYSSKKEALVGEDGAKEIVIDFGNFGKNKEGEEDSESENAAD